MLDKSEAPSTLMCFSFSFENAYIHSDFLASCSALCYSTFFGSTIGFPSLKTRESGPI